MTGSWPLYAQRFAAALFKSIVKLYPAAYRERYGAEMLVTIEDCCRDAYDRQGILSLLLLCSVSTLDFVRMAVQKHREAGLSAPARKRLRWVSTLAFTVGLLGVLTPYGAIQGVLLAPALLGLGVLGYSLTSRSTGPNRAGSAGDMDARTKRAYLSLLATACFAVLILFGNLVRATEGDLRALGGAVGYLSMAGSHLLFFGLGLWLYRRGSAWALLPALAIGAAWIYYSMSDVVRILSGKSTGEMLSSILAVGSFVSAAAVLATGLLGASALLRGGEIVRHGGDGTDRRRTE